jgi:hypothetical protein
VQWIDRQSWLTISSIAARVVSQPTMDLQKFEYLLSFAVPVILMGVGIATDKLIEGKPWARHHFFVGLDLTIYFLAACIVNIVDLTRDTNPAAKGYLWTAGMTAIAVLILFIQTAVHQEWEGVDKSQRGQIFWLCGASNGIGIVLLYAFVRMKLDGLL